MEIIKEKTFPTMLTIKDTSARTGLSEHFLRRLCWSGQITTVKSGRKYLINLEKLIEFLNKGGEVETVYKYEDSGKRV